MKLQIISKRNILFMKAAYFKSFIRVGLQFYTDEITILP